MSESNHTRRRAIGPVCAALAALNTLSAEAAFVDPQSSPWGGWSRSDAGAAYAGWNFFADETAPGGVITDSTPDLSANTLLGGGAGSGPNLASIGFSAAQVTETTGGAFVTGGGNIYSPSVATDFDITLNLSNALAGPVRVALQTRTLGSELDYAGVRVNGVAADAITELERITLGGFGGDQVDTLFVWTLAAGVSSLAFDVTAAESSVSFDALTVDVAPVPLPAAAWLLGCALVPLARRVRHGGCFS